MSYTLNEIRKQPRDWQTTIDQMIQETEKWKHIFSDKHYRNVYFTGCGTSYYLSIAASYLFQEITGINARALPASEVLLLPEKIFDKNEQNLLIGVGRSGTTTESVEAIRKFKEEGYGDALSIACRSNAPSSAVATYSIELPHVDEKSIVMTGTFTNVLLTTQVLAAIVSGNESYLNELQQLPAIGERVLPLSEVIAEKYGRDMEIKQFIYLGIGAYYGLVCEAVLKLKEMTQTPTESYNPLEFRHGPISIVDDTTLVTLFQSDYAPEMEIDVLNDVELLGGKTLLISSVKKGDSSFGLGTNLSANARTVLYMPFVQLVGYNRAVALGLDPDKPRNLTQVVTLSL